MFSARINPQEWANPNQWAVYGHTVPTLGPQDEWPVLWIGYCRAGDVLMAPDARVTGAWLAILAGRSDLLLTVYSLHESGHHAMREALRLIRLHRPAVNGQEKLHGPGNRRPVRCEETGELFECAADACRKYGIHKSQMSVYLTRRDGRKLKGLTFVYV